MTHMEATAIRYFVLLLGLAGLGVVCSGLRAYARDAFRQRAFTIRDELFDYAADGHIAFNDPAYWRLRLAMNGMIRYSHRLTFGEAILPVLIYILIGRPSPATPARDAWKKALVDKPADVQQALIQFDDRFDMLAATHLILTTPFAWPLFLLLVATKGFGTLRREVADRTGVLEEEALSMDGNLPVAA